MNLKIIYYLFFFSLCISLSLTEAEDILNETPWSKSSVKGSPQLGILQQIKNLPSPPYEPIPSASETDNPLLTPTEKEKIEEKAIAKRTKLLEEKITEIQKDQNWLQTAQDAAANLKGHISMEKSLLESNLALVKRLKGMNQDDTHVQRHLKLNRLVRSAKRFLKGLNSSINSNSSPVPEMSSTISSLQQRMTKLQQNLHDHLQIPTDIHKNVANVG